MGTIPREYKSKLIFGEDHTDYTLRDDMSLDEIILSIEGSSRKEVEKRIDELSNTDFAALLCAYENGKLTDVLLNSVLAEINQSYFGKI